VERRFFPLDEQLQLLPGGLTPHAHECLVRLGAWMPFGKAAQMLEEMLGVVVSQALAVRYTEAAGAAYVTLQQAEADRIEREAPPAPAGGEKMVLSADGAMVPLLHGEWAEVRTLAIGEVQPEAKGKEGDGVHTGNLSYFSRLVDASRFEHLSLVEVQRRGLENCSQVAAVVDGADWLQSFIDYHRPDAVRILDFPHAGQRIGQVGEALFGEGSPQASQWTQERLHQLKHQGPKTILEELRLLKDQQPELTVLAENLTYLEKREAQMQYPTFQAQGWPIGSGMVESGNKLVVEVRLKGAGMHWQRLHVDALLALRNIICSDRWSKEWPRIVDQLRQQTQHRRQALRQKHRLVTADPGPEQPSEVQIDPRVLENALKRSSTKANSDEPHRPAPNHPWRRSPVGRARYLPSNHAKN
jgi:hypothetical protein